MKMTHWLAVAAVLVLVGMFLLKRARQTSPDVAQQLVGDGALLLDVRTPEEFTAGHIPGATNIPVGELGSRLGELNEHRSGPVVVYCRSGNRSASARALLETAGFSQVHDLGAMSRWP